MLRRFFQEKAEALEQLTVDVIFGRRDDRAARVWGGVLRVLSCVFHGLVRLRAALYRGRFLRARHLGCLVIVVGNLTVGGTGKTPVVEKLARSLHARGRKVAVLSRGYKSRREPFFRQWLRAIAHVEAPPPRVVSDGESVLLDSEVAGDEPYMLARNLPGVLVITDKDRVKAGLYAIRKFGVDTLILDDGFQYYKLQDHLQLLLIDKSNPFGNGRLLPRGILREPVANMRRASYVFLTKSDGSVDEALAAAIETHRPGTDVIECTHAPKLLRAVHGAEEMPLDALRGRPVAALSAIAVPESFEGFVENLGAELVLRRRFLDHHRFSSRELEVFYAAAAKAGAEWIVTTEKDAVRVPPDLAPDLPFYFLRVEIEILSGVADFEEAVSRICFPKRPRTASRPPFAAGSGARTRERG
ncbi:MAG: tetraacyldisaccharide 4'-kinase [Opitutales bacterium]|nr:tetraacyldisaccharide 4'-kinase [Opitutales bacterium]